jgi:siroheme synthase
MPHIIHPSIVSHLDDPLSSPLFQGPAAKKVVRLKGGDPAVFSRVSSELSALSDAGIPYEIVPGVSSALAAPILAVGH